MKATLLLCDFAQVAEGKLYIAGGGWSVASAMRGYIAALFKVPWDQANHRITATFSLLDQDGSPIPFGPEMRNQMELILEVGRPAGLPRGSDLDVPIAIPLPMVDLPPGSYEWVLQVDGRSDDDWHLPFMLVNLAGAGSPPTPPSAASS